jgi:general secretion pathway protein E
MLPQMSRFLAEKLGMLDATQPDFAPRSVDAILNAAQAAGATDIHLQPTATALDVKFRIDGVLQSVALLPMAIAGNVIARLKVLAGLLTYHTDRPQEGRIRVGQVANLFAAKPGELANQPHAEPGQVGNLSPVEMRVCTYPTLHGERAVVRLFGGTDRYQRLDDLGLPADVLEPLRSLTRETSGAILVSGPAGSGKTTTVYACLREIASGKGDSAPGSRSLVSIEDPIEVAVEGVAQ